MAIHIDQAFAQRIEGQQAKDDVALAIALTGFPAGAQTQHRALMGGQAVCTGRDFPINRGIGMGLAGAVSATELDQLEAFFAQADLPAAVELCPLADASLVAGLEERGYTLYRFYNTYIRPLTPGALWSPPTDITVRIATASEQEQWVWAVTGYTDPGTEAADPLLTLAKATFQRPTITCFLATIQGQIAGGGALSLGEDVAALSFMGTRLEFRGRGVQAALLGARLAHAAAAGCAFVTCTTNPGSQSQRNVQRQGFQLAYTKAFLRRLL